MSTAEGIKFKPITAIIAPVTCGGKYFFTFSTPINLTIKDIITVEEYGKVVTAQVVGVVNMDSYLTRVEEENRLKELAKKKAAIEKELEAEINKRKSVEYYEEMAKKYSDNPKLAELVAELKGLGE